MKTNITPSVRPGHVATKENAPIQGDQGGNRLHDYRHSNGQGPAWKCPSGLKLPPFARQLADARAAGMAPESQAAIIWLDSWPDPKKRVPNPIETVLVMPANDLPSRFDWGFLGGLDVGVLTKEALQRSASA